MTGVDAIRSRVRPAARDEVAPGWNSQGRHPVVLAGRFEPSPEAMLVSAAPLFRRATPATARFSAAATGLDPMGTQELRLRLVDLGGDREVLARNGLPRANADREEGLRPPVSYATARYHGPDTYSLDPSRGDPILLRFHLAPHAGEHRFAAAAARGLAADHLEREMAQRIALRPVLFTWCAEIVGNAGEPDPTAPPHRPERAFIRLGVVRLERMLGGAWDDGVRPRPPADFKLITLGPRGGGASAPPELGDLS